MVLPIVLSYGPTTGEPLGRHMDVDMVTFIGSTETGRRFLQYAADSNLDRPDRVQEILNIAADCLVAAGRLGIFTPMFYHKARKPG